MNILILEDSQERIEQFKASLILQKLYIFDNILDAKRECIVTDFNVMFLDHDLDNRMWVDSKEENTGYQFIKWMVDNQIQQDSLFYIHSMNPCGANKMLNCLLDNGYDGIWIPYRLLKF